MMNRRNPTARPGSSAKSNRSIWLSNGFEFYPTMGRKIRKEKQTQPLDPIKGFKKKRNLKNSWPMKIVKLI